MSGVFFPLLACDAPLGKVEIALSLSQKAMQTSVSILHNITMSQSSKRKQVNSVKGTPGNRSSSLGRGRHVRQVTPDRHQASVSNKSLTIATWNVRTLLGEKKQQIDENKLNTVIGEMKRMSINVLGLSETHLPGWDDIELEDGYRFVYSGGQQHARGVGFILDNTCSQALLGYSRTHDRAMAIKLRGKPFDLGITQVYAPTTSCGNPQLEEFYATLDAAMKTMKSKELKIVMGDFNAKVGKGRSENIVGPHGLGQRNERGDRLEVWCKEHDFIVTNTWFENHVRRLWTWESPGGRCKNQIDFILVQERFRNAITSSKARPGVEKISDHIPVVAKMKLRLKKVNKATDKPVSQFHLLYKSDKLREKYSNVVHESFKALDNFPGAEERWQTMKKCIHDATKKYIPQAMGRRNHKKWMTQDILGLMEQRHEAKMDGDGIKFKELNKAIKKKCRKEKNSWINDLCKNIEKYTGVDETYIKKEIREASGKRSYAETSSVNSQGGKVLKGRKKVKKPPETLFHDSNQGAPPEMTKELEGPAITVKEVTNALKQMKVGRAPGPDGIPSEVLVALGKKGIIEITKLLNIVYDSGEIPLDMKRSVVSLLPQRHVNPKYRMVTVVNHITKVLLQVLMARLRSKLLSKFSHVQFAFVRDKSTKNVMFMLSTLIENALKVKKDLFLCPLYYSKAFDEVKTEDLFNILVNLDVDGKDLRIIRNFYWEQEVDIYCGIPKIHKKIRSGFRLECGLSSFLFTLYMELIFKEFEKNTLNMLRYGNEIILVCYSQQQLQSLLETVLTKCDDKGLKLSVNDIEFIVFSRTGNSPPRNIEYKGVKIKQVKSFQYLEYILTSDGKHFEEIRNRIVLAHKTLNEMKFIFANRNIGLNSKENILRIYISSILLHGCESWTLHKNVKKYLKYAEWWFCEIIMKLSKKKIDEYCLSLSLENMIRKRQLEFFGHVVRRNGLEKDILCFFYNNFNNKVRGRPRETLTRQLMWCTGYQGMTEIDFIKKTQNRKKWKAMIRNVRT